MVTAKKPLHNAILNLPQGTQKRMKIKSFCRLQVQIPFQVFKSSSLNKAKQKYTPFFTLLHMVWQAQVVLELVILFFMVANYTFCGAGEISHFLFSVIFTG